MQSVSYDPRTIGLASEILFPPIDLDVQRVQAIHNLLYQDSESRYQNFQVGQDGVQLSNPASQPGQSSSLTFQPDRITVQEELGPWLPEDFGRRVIRIAEVCMAELSLPMLVAQQHTIRMLVTPKNFQDSRDFLAGRVCGLTHEELHSFERPIGLFGLKLVFPASEAGEEFHALRIESFGEDPRSVFLENVSTYPRPIQSGGLAAIEQSLVTAQKFLIEKALAFLATRDMGGQ